MCWGTSLAMPVLICVKVVPSHENALFVASQPNIFIIADVPPKFAFTNSYLPPGNSVGVVTVTQPAIVDFHMTAAVPPTLLRKA
jgi:hypothetical protein